MPAITPSFVFSYERRMKAIIENEYSRRLAAENMWWNKIVRVMNLEGRTQRITWLLDTATISPAGPDFNGTMTFEDMVTQSVEYPTLHHNKGIRVTRDQLEDLDGTGLDQLAKWSENIGNEIAYYPQVLAAQLLLNGSATNGSANAYDGVPFFTALGTANPHPVNPFDSSVGHYYNDLTGAAGTGADANYPGACPIDETVTVDVALANLNKILAYIASIKMPNGRDPRYLTPAFVLAPPRLFPRLGQLTDAKFIAQAAASGGGSGDIVGYISRLGLGQPIRAAELGAAQTYNGMMPIVGASGTPSYVPFSASGDDKTFYVVCQEMQTTQLGGLLYLERKPFQVNFYTGDGSGATGIDSILQRMKQVEYQVDGRVAQAYGHPYTIFKCRGS